MNYIEKLQKATGNPNIKTLGEAVDAAVETVEHEHEHVEQVMAENARLKATYVERPPCVDHGPVEAVICLKCHEETTHELHQLSWDCECAKCGHDWHGPHGCLTINCDCKTPMTWRERAEKAETLLRRIVKSTPHSMCSDAEAWALAEALLGEKTKREPGKCACGGTIAPDPDYPDKMARGTLPPRCMSCGEPAK